MANALTTSILFTIILFPLCILSQRNGNITVGSTITASENSTPWLSPSGDFAFGFQQLPNSTDLFVLSIWYNRIPDRTIVWFERNSYPVLRGSTIRLDAAQGLLLRSPGGGRLWTSRGITQSVAYGFMNNTGNFILSGDDSTWLWQSFRNPSDTMLPTQTIELTAGQLNSRRTRTNFSEGRFWARMDADGDFQLQVQTISNRLLDDIYNTSNTADATNSSNAGFQLLFNSRAEIIVLRRNGQSTTLTPSTMPPASDNYYRATIDFDGVFTLYSHPRNLSGNPRWNPIIFWPENICTSVDGDFGSGVCGFNSYCRLESGRPECQCAPGYTLEDPGYSYGNCLPINLPPYCMIGENGSAFDFLTLRDVDWPFNDYEQLDPSTLEECSNSCLNDCLCAGVNFLDNRCYKKTLPLTNGRVAPTLGIVTLFKVRRINGQLPSVPTPNVTVPDQPIVRSTNRNTLTIVVSALLGSSIFINCLFVVAACFGFFLIYSNKKIPFLHPVQSSTVGANLRCFTYKELLQATEGFKEELGRGAFAIVYKGLTSDGSNSTIAVKKLDRVSRDTEKEFRAEVNTIGQTHHKNLVRLLGFCDEGPNRLLVYEYMSNGTLADFLFGDSKPSWSQRCLIGMGVARGLTYLHDECITQIIHCDIKPQNILIDENYNSRISDFGLAKLLEMNQTRAMTNIRGTKGYVAPEWFRNTQITTKVDVYSFGVLLLEIVSCRKSVENMGSYDDEANPIILTDWVWDCFQEKRLDSLVDGDTEALIDRTRLERFVRVGLWCIQEEASLRPTMRKASQMLEGILEVGVPPCPSPPSLYLQDSLPV